MKNNLELLAEDLLIEKFFNHISVNSLLVKEAQVSMISSILSPIGDSLKQFVSGQTAGKDNKEIIKTIVNFLTPAVFFKLHPILGIVAAVASSVFHFDLYGIFEKIINTIKPSLEKGESVSASTINNAAKSAMPDFSDEASVNDKISSNLLYPLIELEEKGLLEKKAFVKSSANAFENILKGLGRKKGSSVIVGILVWFLKRFLLAAGLLAAGAAVVYNLKPSKEEGKSETVKEEKPYQYSAETSVTKVVPKSTSKGSKLYKINPGDVWIENIGNKKPFEVILNWVFESYPDLYQYKNIILNTPSFWSTVNDVSAKWKPGQMRVEIPDPFKKRDDVLNLFIKDVFDKINK